MRWGMRGPFWAQSRQHGDGGVPAWSRDVPKGGGKGCQHKAGMFPREVEVGNVPQLRMGW